MIPLTLEVYDKHGVQYEPAFRNLRFAKTFYGGEDLWMVFVLDRDGSRDYPDVAYGNDVMLRDGLTPGWKGEIRQIETDLETVTVKCLGMWVHLDDYGYGGTGKLWCESRYGKWRIRPVGVNIAPERFELYTDEQIYLAPRKGEQFSPSFCGSIKYISPGYTFRRISFDYDVTLAANWRAQLYVYDVDFSNAVRIWYVTGVTQAGVKDISIVLGSPFHAPTWARQAVAFVLEYNAALAQFTGDTGTCYAKFTNVRLWGEEGPLSRATENPAAHHIAEDIVSQIQAATPISADDELVQESLFVRDTFTDANGTSLDAHPPDINKERASWVEVLGNWDIQGNEANVAAVFALAVIAGGVSDGIVCADAKSTAAGVQWLGIVFRYLDGSNYWMWDYNPSTGEARLRKYVIGASTVVWQQSIGMEFAYWYNLMVKFRGDRIDCYIGGVWRTGTTDSDNKNYTRCGLRASDAGAVGARFDNFEVFQALPIWPLFYERGESCHKALADVVSYGDWDFRALGWGVEPGGDRLYLKRADRSRVRYVVPPHHASRLSATGQTDKDFVTEAWGKYIDEDGVERWTVKYYAHVTSAGIVANTTATGDDLASVVYGVTREAVIDFGRVDAVLAVEYLRRYLVEHAHPQVKSSFEIFAPVRDLFKGGAWIQPYEIEMGYLVQIPYFRAVEAEGAALSDLRDWDTTFLLVAMEYDAERGMAKLIPEEASEDLGRLMKYVREFERGEEKALTEKRQEASFKR